MAMTTKATKLNWAGRMYSKYSFWLLLLALTFEQAAFSSVVGDSKDIYTERNKRKSITVVFLMQLGSSPPRLTGASIHRGIATADVLFKSPGLNASAVLCSNARAHREIDVFVHVKSPCRRILASKSQANVHDVVDYTGPLGPFSASFAATIFAATIFASEFDMMKRCKTRLCAVIPHHFNLDCERMIPDETKGIGLVGTSYSTASVEHIESRLGLSLIREIPGQPCAFFRSIRIAVAWEGPNILHYEDAPGGNLQVKPAERYTNPVHLGIPTIGYRGYHSFREYGEEFMCKDLQCVRSLITQIEHGKVNSTFERSQEIVTRDTGRTVLSMRFRALLEATKAASSGHAVSLLTRSDFNYKSTIISHIERWYRQRKYWKRCSDLGLCEMSNLG